MTARVVGSEAIGGRAIVWSQEIGRQRRASALAMAPVRRPEHGPPPHYGKNPRPSPAPAFIHVFPFISDRPQPFHGFEGQNFMGKGVSARVLIGFWQVDFLGI